MRSTDHRAAGLRKEYLAANPRCQYTMALGKFVDFGSHISHTLCVDHIFNRLGDCESWSNYATACPSAHDWKHANSVPARIAIVWIKLRLAKQDGDWRHFDLSDLHNAAGFHVQGWIANKLEDNVLPSWCIRMAREVAEWGATK